MGDPIDVMKAAGLTINRSGHATQRNAWTPEPWQGHHRPGRARQDKACLDAPSWTRGNGAVGTAPAQGIPAISLGARSGWVQGVALVALVCVGFPLAAQPPFLDLTLRSRPGTPDQPPGPSQTVQRQVKWDPRKTAIVICDMWNDHWCKSAARRVTELAGPMNAVVRRARDQGVFIIHAPSSVTDFYRDTPQRRRAQVAPFHSTKVPLATDQRWGTAWCWPDPDREGELPIDDSDMGCDCPVKCQIREAWTRQIDLIDIADPDAITDHGQETFNLLEERGITNVVLMGVHLNMCVLGRPFGIRQLSRLGKNVVLMRDLTDTMYDPRRPPKVSHFAGTDLVVEHVEKYWCPTVTSTVFTGRPPFRFQDDKRTSGR